MPYTEEHPPRAWITILPKAAELAKAVADTDFVPRGLRGNPAAITACVLYGDEVGLEPMQALAHIAVIDGRPTMSAEAMRGLILAAGHELWTEDATNTRVTVAGRRRDSDQTSRVTWTLDDAKRAGIAGKVNWQKYPRQMLLARASAELARAIFADAIGGLVAREEIEDAETGAQPDHAPPVTQRRRRAALAPVETVTETGPPHSAAGAAVDTSAAPSVTQAAEVTEAGEEGANPSPTPSAAARTMTDAQRPKLMALFNESGMSKRETRLAFATMMIGRKIESANELTVDEASKLIDLLERRNANVAAQAAPEDEDELLRQLQATLDAREKPTQGDLPEGY